MNFGVLEAVSPMLSVTICLVQMTLYVRLGFAVLYKRFHSSLVPSRL